MKRLTIVATRHGHASPAVKNDDKGRPLSSEKGVPQAKRIGEILAERITRPFDLVLTSPSTRTIETADFALDSHPGSPLPVPVDILYPAAGDLPAVDRMFDILGYAPLTTYKKHYGESGEFGELETWGGHAVDVTAPLLQILREQDAEALVFMSGHAICIPMFLITFLMGEDGIDTETAIEQLMECSMGEADALIVEIDYDNGDGPIKEVTVTLIKNPLSEVPKPKTPLPQPSPATVA